MRKDYWLMSPEMEAFNDAMSRSRIAQDVILAKYGTADTISQLQGSPEQQELREASDQLMDAHAKLMDLADLCEANGD